MKESQVIEALSAMAQDTRLRIVRFLVTKGAEGAPAGEIGAAVDSVSSRTSFHLAALTRAGLLSSQKVSRQVIYRANFDTMGALMAYLLHDCCGSNAQVLACCETDAACCGPDPSEAL